MLFGDVLSGPIQYMICGNYVVYSICYRVHGIWQLYGSGAWYRGYIGMLNGLTKSCEHPGMGGAQKGSHS